MSVTRKDTERPQKRKSRVVSVDVVEGPRWSSLAGRMTPEERRVALQQVAAKMR